MEIFSKADDEDRAGMANKSTARTFYAAGTFFDILNQFGDISEDVGGSDWVGESVRSAGVMSASELDSTWHGPATTSTSPPPPAPSHSAPAAPPAPSHSTPTAPPAPTPTYQPAPAQTPSYQPPAPPAPAYQPPPSYTPQSTPSRARDTPISQNELNDALEYAKFAVAALKVSSSLLKYFLSIPIPLQRLITLCPRR
ncbi:unnamed protein product [Phytophthora lilii]|uniref:Unnamed protein product n=1 Tax=Phytophthora lilii TaxID=2077276 RepID=A0A9W6WUJ5_9STRA|nr:unnamed protein product [Phytophthora lilii]